ncbi:hypothetical protein [Burkholderia vietnamiensis]|uniref:hypothetical protein n=1 Tax=Burkholderia vietnamiensis TaxID=60552 RepID=UPI001593221F|nr:hypothetical protein [Burkholderia vietnamiensis]
MRPIPARPEQPQSPAEIIRAALRAAAIAPTVFDALDVTGDALRRLAELSARDPGAFRRFSSPEQSSSLEVRA